jgi:dipeptidyl aminopeptidase/acylaminoacyl peptidase
MVHYIESSPADQLQPKHTERFYQKPGDVLDRQQPVLFDVEAKRQIPVDNSLFGNPYSLTRIEWREDSRAFTFEYNERSHQVYRIIEVDATSGRARAVVSEEEDTFFYYRAASGGQTDSGSRFRFDVDDGREVVWMSERDGWKHLYLYDGTTGQVKNQITKGEWVVRAVDTVDVANRRIWFRAGGVSPDQDPYFVHSYSINFDGTGLTAYTEADGNHSVSWSPDRAFYIDLWSRVDLAPIMQLRRTRDRQVVMELERGDYTAQLETGWRPPEIFVSKGRDGETDIWGIIVRPTNFDPGRTYPVIEQIYAGPQGSFVPKSFNAFSQLQAQAELGFIVVQIDGMGTANRSKAFHDVAWRNLGDAGFPDRIVWHRAVAAKYSYYDTTRVGIYGGSAGGQNALGGMLFHGDFYKAAVSSVGCHDNRMDKIWWNELWMGSPLGPHYEASSNVVHADKLKGKLLLVVGELDTNVDPASTLQVVNALIRADKYFDLLYIPGAGHGSGGDYGTRKRYDFFVTHLLGVDPPDWTAGVVLTEDGSDLDFDFEDDADAPPDFFDRPDPDHPPGGAWTWM